MKTTCAMTPYSQFVGTWSDYRSDYKFQKLPIANHSALGDCMATLKVIQKMASHEMKTMHELQSTSNKKETLQSDKEKAKKWWEIWK